ncbi:PDR/VanB family oxidoreductase [Pseudomonas sp. PSKL.D1]|uniref:PDR/VanB family oxidoreductase n=1 Tax=Pseudomonas sp. PSKL.D1 TaxID=3029060 RepID=UPI002380E615|nr:PDR/VanB family oxidoreductase [Pseudomonas sp. PSKL.D1]WDY59943.1 PDR/VanB family oxidoreductase [Pseudomonas sp. PSKL.D1]
MSWTSLQVQALRLESQDVLGVELVAPEAAPLPFDWSPGAHVDLRLGNGVVRQYSIISLPESGHLYLGIKREPASRGGSRWLHEQLRLGARLDVGTPRNLFALQPGHGPVTLVAAGIGITPLLPMYHQCRAQQRPVRLLYFTRDTHPAPFIARLNAHIEHYAGLGAEQIADCLADQLPGWTCEASLYTCGPAGFMDCVQRVALTRGWPTGALHREHFQSSAPAVSSEQGSLLVLQRSGKEVQLQPRESLVQAAERVGVALPVSCGMGICGACVSRVIEGEPEHRDDYLSAEQRASGQWIAPCVSGCRGARLVLDA